MQSLLHVMRCISTMIFLMACPRNSIAKAAKEAETPKLELNLPVVGQSSKIVVRGDESAATDQSIVGVCHLPKEPGTCKHFHVKWHFDIAYGGCSRFWYGGCEGNGNNFADREECEEVCVNPHVPEACLLPMVAGPCEMKIPSWYFDPGSKTCKPFIYSGCQGNYNRFDDKTDCEVKCITKQPPGESSAAKAKPEPASIKPGRSVIRTVTGKPVELPCNAKGYPRPNVTWWRQSTMLPLPSRRFELLPNNALRIKSVQYEDWGEYSCRASNNIGAGDTYTVTLETYSAPEISTSFSGDGANFPDPTDSSDNEPASIKPGPRVIRAEVGKPADLPCNAKSYPRPTVTWWHKSTMLPLFSRRYEQRQNNALRIKSVQYTDVGEYSCHASNAIGAGDIFTVKLEPYSPPETSTSSRGDDDNSPAPPDSWDSELVSVAVSLVTSNPKAGSPLQVDCDTKGPIDTKVTWQFGNNYLVLDARRRILLNNTLFIAKADLSDSGEYKCIAHYHSNVATSAIYVEVKPLFTESTCLDNSEFINCTIVVINSYCSNEHYGKYCCASCMRAGQKMDTQ